MEHSASHAQQHYLPSLDGLRAICIVLVLGSHAALSTGFPPELRHWTQFVFNGKVGVLAFFVISGFLITYLLLREEDRFASISLRSFYARRAVRILPVYFAYLGVVAALDLVSRLDLSRCQYLTAVSFTKNFGCSAWVDGHLWSLAVEEQFYLLWPLTLVWGTQRTRAVAALLVVLVAPVARAALYWLGLKEASLYSFPANMDALMAGCLLAFVLVRHEAKGEEFFAKYVSLGRFCAVASIYLVVALTTNAIGGPFTVPFGTSVQAFAAAYLIGSYVVVRRGASYSILNLRPVAFVGVLSYSIYIWQQLYFTNARSVGWPELGLLEFPGNIAAATVTGAASYILLERPLLRLRKKLSSSRTNVPVAAAAARD